MKCRFNRAVSLAIAVSALLLLPEPFTATVRAETNPPQSYSLGRESGRAIMEKRRQLQTIDSEVAAITLTIIDDGGEITNRQLLAATRRNDYGRFDYLVRFLAPEEISGTTLLSKEKEAGNIEQFLYLPALGMVNAITGEARRRSFMGSDFTYEDLQRESTADYQYAYVGDSRIGSRAVYKVVAVASAPGTKRITGYARRILYLHKETLDILKIEFFDASNVHEKTLEAYDYGSEEVEGSATRPHRAVMSNHLKGTTSVMTLRKSRLNVPIDADLFLRENLKSITSADVEGLLGQF